MIAQSGAIISGSAALVILQLQQEPNDIDFYVPPRGLAQLLKFVLDHGYELTVPVPRRGGEGGYP